MAYSEKTNQMGKTKMINDYSLKYHKKRLKNFWKRWAQGGKHYRSINWWMGCIKLEPMKAGKEARALIKDFIRVAVLEEKISIEEGNRLSLIHISEPTRPCH
jgi:hypothetical protein